MIKFLKYIIYIIIIFNCHFGYAQDALPKQINVESIVDQSDSVDEFSKVVSEVEHPIIKTALKLLGTPYKWGATGHGAFDCSGFTHYVFGENGYVLPRVSRDQSKMGQKVNDYSLLQPGDLIFFGGRTDMYQVHHVGIVKSREETGEITFIHASCRKGVTISSLNEPYYRIRYLGAKRILEN